jgi:hypothetical protein
MFLEKAMPEAVDEGIFWRTRRLLSFAPLWTGCCAGNDMRMTAGAQ